MAGLTWHPTLIKKVAAEAGRQYHNTLRGPRVGVMLHYDGSGSDKGGISWFEHPECQVSYQWAVTDDGDYVEIAPPSARAFHAGLCAPSNPGQLGYTDANSAFYGIAALTNDRVDVTPLQLATITWLAKRCFQMERWPMSELFRITGHSAEAVHKDGSRRRKVDPEGPEWWAGTSKNPIFTPDDVRQLFPGVQL